MSSDGHITSTPARGTGVRAGTSVRSELSIDERMFSDAAIQLLIDDWLVPNIADHIVADLLAQQSEESKLCDDVRSMPQALPMLAGPPRSRRSSEATSLLS